MNFLIHSGLKNPNSTGTVFDLHDYDSRFVNGNLSNDLAISELSQVQIGTVENLLA